MTQTLAHHFRATAAATAALLVLASPRPSQAASLFEDHLITVFSVLNCPLSSPSCDPTSGAMIVLRPGVDTIALSFGPRGQGAATAFLTDNTLRIDFTNSWHFADQWPLFNGLLFETLGAPDITSLELLHSSIPLFTEQIAYRMPWREHTARFDFGGLDVKAGDRLEFIFNSPVPEPTPAALLAAGLCGLLWVSRRRATKRYLAMPATGAATAGAGGRKASTAYFPAFQHAGTHCVTSQEVFDEQSTCYRY
jgi:hypothetical protein